MAIKKVYWAYRHKWLNDWSRYTPSYFLNKQFKDYFEAWLTKILDNEIPEERYTLEIVPGVKHQGRFIIWEYEDTVIDPVEFADSIAKVWAEFAVKMFNSVDEAVKRILTHTDLQLIDSTQDVNGVYTYAKFLISPETQWADWELMPAQYLIID